MLNLVVRIFGITFACAAGYPVGREGPMVCIGGSIGVQVVDRLARRYVQRKVDVHLKGEGAEMTPALIIDNVLGNILVGALQQEFPAQLYGWKMVAPRFQIVLFPPSKWSRETLQHRFVILIDCWK